MYLSTRLFKTYSFSYWGGILPNSIKLTRRTLRLWSLLVAPTIVVHVVRSVSKMYRCLHVETGASSFSTGTGTTTTGSWPPPRAFACSCGRDMGRDRRPQGKDIPFSGASTSIGMQRIRGYSIHVTDLWQHPFIIMKDLCWFDDESLT